MKNGLALEKSNDYSGALKVYEQIEQEYPASPEGRDIEKYIERAQLKLKNNRKPRQRGFFLSFLLFLQEYV